MNDDNPTRRPKHSDRAPLQSGIVRRPKRTTGASSVPPPVEDAPPVDGGASGGGFWSSKSGFGDASPIAAAETAPSVPNVADAMSNPPPRRAAPPVARREMPPPVKAEPPSRPSLQSVPGLDATERTWLDTAMDATIAEIPAASGTRSGRPTSNQPAVGASSHGGSSSLGPSGTQSGVGQRPAANTGPQSAANASDPGSVSGVGLQLPGYRMLKVLGKGGMGEVCLAERISSAGVPVKCVVKTILPHATRDQQYRELFLDEARLVSHLRHPNVVTVMECGQQGEVLFQAMEWIEGLDAGELMAKANAQTGGIPLRHLLYVLREVLQGLHYAHTAVDQAGQPLHIVHRDISPGNVLISRQGAVKLADFGVAVGTASHTEGARESLAGKPHYFAPELWKGATASPGTDVFALAVSFYELLSGKPLFDRQKSLRALAWEICNFTPDALLDSDLTVPDGLETIIRRSLAPEPADRYTSALEFLEDVNDYAYEYGIRLLDAHFARYVERVLGGGDKKRRHLFAGDDDA